MLRVRASFGLAIAEAQVETDVLGHAFVGVEPQLVEVLPPGLVVSQGHEPPPQTASLRSGRTATLEISMWSTARISTSVPRQVPSDSAIQTW